MHGSDGSDKSCYSFTCIFVLQINVTGFLFTVERLSASRSDCIAAARVLLQVAVVAEEHKPIK